MQLEFSEHRCQPALESGSCCTFRLFSLGQGTFGGEYAVAEMALCLLDVLFLKM